MAYTHLIDPKKTETHTWCALRGVSRGVIFGKYLTDWYSYLQPYEFNGKQVSAQLQHKWFKQADSNIFQPSFTAIVGMNQSMIEQIAFYLFLTAYYQSNPMDKMPYWHTLTGGKTDTLRDDMAAGSMLGAPINFLVLTNVSAGASFAKTEKVRDLVAQYNHLPRLLVLSASDPMSYFDTQLYMTPSKILFVDDRSCR